MIISGGFRHRSGSQSDSIQTSGGTIKRLHLMSWHFRSAVMSDTLPDHLSIDPNSPFFDEAVLERGIGIRFNGTEKTNIQEYSVSEGWVRVSVGKTVDRRGQPLTIKLKG